MASEEIWVLADDRPGNVAQALGVAEVLGEPFSIRPIRYDAFGGLPNLVRGRSLLGIARPERDLLVPPWPRLVVAAGRRTAPVGRWIKAVSGRARLVQIMDPGWPGRGDFDLIAAPIHDARVPGENVIRTLGSCHRVVPDLLAREKAAWEGRLAHLPRPFLVLVVGGKTKDYDFTPAFGRQLAALASASQARTGGSILVTTSRRTAPDLAAVIAENLPEPNIFHYWREGGENPYFAFLASADCIIVTGDSMNMCSEACATPAPVYIFAPSGLTNRKHARLHTLLFERGYARPAGEDWSDWAHPTLNASFDVAAEIRRRGLLMP
jgi:hypothetical protein